MRALETAAAYRELGWAVLPLCGVAHRCPTPGKIPVDLTSGHHLAHSQRRGVPTPQEIDGWLRTPLAARANLGCLTGSRSGIVALDVDGPGGEALLTLHAHGDLPPTWEYRTGGGRRIIYRYAPGMRSIKLAGDGTHEGLEVLSDGRQMVVPPSLHKAGPSYAWVPGRDPWTFGPAASCPDWLTDLVVPQAKRPRQDWARIASQPVSAGGRHPTLVQLAAHMAAHHEDPSFILAMLLAWNETRCKPPKPPEEVARIVTWALDQHDPNSSPAARDPWETARTLGCSLDAARQLIQQEATS